MSTSGGGPSGRVLDGRYRVGARIAILATLALGTAFLATKGYEYHGDLSEHLFPTLPDFPFTAVGAVRFWTFYWTITLIQVTALLFAATRETSPSRTVSTTALQTMP